jgi:hypothetical protein
MSRSAPATAETPAPSESADRSGRLLHALLSSAGLSIREDAAERQPAQVERKQRPRRRRTRSPGG